MMSDLSATCRRLLRSLIEAPLAWQTPAQLAARLDADHDTTSEALADLDAGGWLDPWELDGAIYVTLTALAAERLGVRLEQIGRSDGMRWASIADPEPSPRVSSRGQGDVDAFDGFADPGPGPEALAEASERAARLATANRDRFEPPAIEPLPRPSILLGLGLTPWPGPRPERGRDCPGCGSKPIAEKAYCLVCDRWGLDHLLNAARVGSAPARPPRRPTPNAPRDVEAAKKSAKAARKAKRRRKWAKSPAARPGGKSS